MVYNVPQYVNFPPTRYWITDGSKPCKQLLASFSVHLSVRYLSGRSIREQHISVCMFLCITLYTRIEEEKELYPPPSSIFSTCHNGRPRGDMSPQKRDTPKRMNTKRKRRKGNSLWRARNVDVASDKFGTWDTITVRVWHLGSCGFIPTNPLHLLLSCNWTEYIELSWLIIQWRFRN